MPRVNRIQKCRKSPGKCGKCGIEIKPGDPYLFWAFNPRFGGGKHIRCTKLDCGPKPSELTSSAYLGAIADIQNREMPGNTADELESGIEDIKNEIEQLRDEQQEKRDNMPESLQDSPTGEMLGERADACDSAISDLESIDLEDLRQHEEEEPTRGDPQWLEANPEPQRQEGETDEHFQARYETWQEQRDASETEEAYIKRKEPWADEQDELATAIWDEVVSAVGNMG